VEEKYYADGEDAYDMRKSFKDVKSKPAILPKGSASQKNREPKAAEVQEPSPAQDSTGTQPAADTQAEKAEGKSQDAADKSATSASADTKGSQSKAKASRTKKR